jgi:hypothetical protein
VLVTAYPPLRRMIEADSLDLDLPDGPGLRDLIGWLNASLRSDDRINLLPPLADGLPVTASARR